MSRLISLLVILTITTGVRAQTKVDFTRDILPILSDKCFHCHGPDKAARKGKLRLDEETAAKKAVIVAGKSAESEIVKRLLSKDPHEQMPPAKLNRPMTKEQIDLVARWIDEGAVWGKHWAFTPLVAPPIPKIAGVTNPIDAFVVHRLEKEKLSLSPPAAPETILRRVKLDLTGLPPTLEEIAAFKADKSPQAYEKMVARIIDSPAFGERMAWDWLDAARYADSNGYQGDGDRTMWPWRDWVVSAFNSNMPYDRFTLWQLAGDLLPEPTPEQKLATGFNRNHMINGEGGRIAEENRIDYVMDMTETMGTVWLGLTLNCCRCHDHKYDPIAQADYYRLFALFNQTPVNGGGGDPQTAPVMELLGPGQAEKLAELNKGIAALAKDVATIEIKLFPRDDGKTADTSDAAKTLPDAVKTALKTNPDSRGPTAISNIEKEFNAKEPDYVKALSRLRVAVDGRNAFNRTMPRVMIMEDIKTPRKTFLLDKGLYNKPKDEVQANILPQMAPLPKDAPMNRLGLAKWLLAPDQPLTARVTVNRVWQQFFGAGLVKSIEDLGHQAETPAHPELLDWLADDFVRSGWDMKHLIRRIVTSDTYRQSSKLTKDLAERDPANRLYARGPRFRLPSWMIRDQALASSGLLVDVRGGPPVFPYQPTGIWEEATFGGKRYTPDKGDKLYRRSLYTFWRRIVGPTMFFDSAPRQTCSVKGTRTNTPLHALATLNDTTYVEAARALAQRVMLAEKEPAARIDLAFRLVLARSPSADESEILVKAAQRHRQQFDKAMAAKLLSVGDSKRDERLDAIEHAAYTIVCNTILNLDETLNKD